MAGNTLMTLLVKLGVDSSSLDKGLKDSEKKTLGSAQKMSGGLSGMAGRAAGMVGGVLVKGALVATGALVSLGVAGVAAFGKMASAGIDMDKMLEMATLQFTTLMGSADKAKAHVQGLFAIAAKTPFEAQDIIGASKALLTFGGAALNTEKNILMVGDAAAATGANIGEVANWVGRAYSAIQSGRPFGEAAQRLQELGILSADARNEIEALQKSGAKSDVIWAKLTGTLNKFGGAMSLQANTWEGLMSTIKDNINLALGSAFKPLFDMFKEGLKGIAAFTTGETFSGWMKQLGTMVSNLVKSFGPGGALRAVVSTFIGFIKPLMAGLFSFLASINWNAVGNNIMIFILRIRQGVKAMSVYWDKVLLPAIVRAVVWIIANVGKVATFLGGVWKKIQTGFASFLAFIRPLIGAFQAAMAGDWYKFGALMRTFWAGVLQSLINVFKKIKWGDVGKNILAGIANGIMNNVKWLVDAAIYAAQAAYDAARGFLGIHSPSALFAGVGENMMLGMAKGIGNLALAPQVAMLPALASVAAAPMSQGVAPTSGGASANFYFQFGDAVTQAQAQQMVDASADSLIRAFTAAVRERRR